MNTHLWSTPAAAIELAKLQFPQEVEECILLAEELCQNRFTFRGHWEMERTHTAVEFSQEIVWDKTPNGDPEWVFAFNRHSFLVTLGQAWSLTGNKKYAYKAAELWENWIDNVTLNESAHSTTWRPIEAGIRCESWLRALELFGTALESRLIEKIKGCLYVHGEWLLQSHTPFQKLSNWGVLQDHGLLLLGIALGEPKWMSVAASRLEEQLSYQVLADGTHWEQSPLYHCEVLHCCLDSLQAAKRVEYSLPEEFVRRVHLMSLALGKMLRPDGKLFCQSDSDEVDARDLMALAGMLFDDSTLKGYADGGFYFENCWDFGDQIAAYDTIDTKQVKESAALPDSGNYMLRDGSDPKSGMLHFHCGSLGSGHGHADLLHMDLVYRGETILADSGRYTYVDSEIRRALKSPMGHNTVTVDGLDFTTYQSSWSYESIAEPVKGEYRFTPHVDYVSGAHLGYLNAGVFVRRRILRLGRNLWLVWDDFHVSDPKISHCYERYFHFSSTAIVEKTDANAINYTGADASAQMLFPGENITIKKEQTYLSKEYNQLEKGDFLCVQSTHKGPIGYATVIATGDKDSPTPLTASVDNICLVSTGEALPKEKGQAVHIQYGNEHWTAMLLNTEVISEVSLLESRGHQGYGKVQVFGPPCPKGLCLSW